MEISDSPDSEIKSSIFPNLVNTEHKVETMKRPPTPFSLLSLLPFCALLLTIAISGCGDDKTIVGAQDAILVVNPTNISFENVMLGDESSQPLSISNKGTGLLTIRTLELRGSGEFFLDAPSTPIEIEGGGEILLNVTYAPSDIGRDEGYVFIESNSNSNPQAIVNIATLSVEPEILVTPNPISFGRVPSGQTEIKTAKITNIGQAPLHFDSIDITGSPDFTLKIKTTDEITPAELDPGGSFEMEVIYAPPTDGPDTADLLIFSDDTDEGELRVPILANGAAPVLVVSPDSIDFGETFVGGIKSQTVTLTNLGQQMLEIYSIELVEGEGKFFIEHIPPELEGGFVEIAYESSITFQVNYAPDSLEAHTGKIVLSSNDDAFETFEIPLFGRGSNNSCPHAVLKATVQGVQGPPIIVDGETGGSVMEGDPLQIIQFTAEDSSDSNDSIGAYDWVLAERPGDSGTRFQTSNSIINPTLFLDLAGTYVIELRVYDSFGMVSCNTPRLTIHVIPRETIHVQLVWDTPNDTVNDECASIWDECGSDLDLHFLHQMGFGTWNQQPWDCYFQNKIPNWGDSSASEDDPSLDIDDVNGFGPENINLDVPEADRDYHVGVYYYDDHGWGPSFATVRIYIHGIVAHEGVGQPMQSDQDFWFAATIRWNMGGTATITPVNRMTNGFP